MVKVKPREVEAEFEFDEMFFSRTDKRGVILEINEVFAKISGYSAEELIGKPHNFVRHPDMPRAIFKILWDTLDRGESITVYVKNLAANGSYYWVLASVFPSDQGYISIRIKPNSKILDDIKPLYQQMLKVEVSGKIEESEAFLMESLAKLGFANYQQFAIQAAETELNERRRLMDLSDAKGSNSFLLALDNFNKVSVELLKICELKDKIEKIGLSMQENYQIIKFVGFNMHISAEHMGSKAVTIGVIASTFQDWAYEVFLHASVTTSAVHSMVKMIDGTTFLIANSRFKIEMIAFERSLKIAESLRKSRMKVFGDYSLESLDLILNNIGNILIHRQEVESAILKLKEAISALHIIQQNGRIEMASMSLESETLRSELDGMRSFIDAVSRESQELSQLLVEMHHRLLSIQSSSRRISSFLTSAIDDTVG